MVGTLLRFISVVKSLEPPTESTATTTLDPFRCTDVHTFCAEHSQVKLELGDDLIGVRWQCRETEFCSEDLSFISAVSVIGGCYDIVNEDDCNISAQLDYNVHGTLINDGVYQKCDWTTQGCKPIGHRCSKDGRCAVGSVLKHPPPSKNEKNALVRALKPPGYPFEAGDVQYNYCSGAWKKYLTYEDDLLYTCNGLCQPWKGEDIDIPTETYWNTTAIFCNPAHSRCDDYFFNCWWSDVLNECIGSPESNYAIFHNGIRNISECIGDYPGINSINKDPLPCDNEEDCATLCAVENRDNYCPIYSIRNKETGVDMNYWCGDMYFGGWPAADGICYLEDWCDDTENLKCTSVFHYAHDSY